MNKRIIFATGNEGKMREVRMILADTGYEIFSMKEVGIDIDIVEDGLTFEDNALIKARAIIECYKDINKDNKNSEDIVVVLADDSGLEVDYMDKAPGVYSARFEGVDTPYSIKNQIIMDRLKGIPEEQRTARFISVIAAVFSDGREVTTCGTLEGTIAYESAGLNGFGYDPIFYLPELGCTTAELSNEHKNEISHRGIALRQMAKEL